MKLKLDCESVQNGVPCYVIDRLGEFFNLR